MKAVILCAIVAFASASSVIELTDSNFADRLEDMDLALVKFYAPWCGHCKKLAPEFDKASTILSTNDPSVNLVKVDCTGDGKDTCDRHEVKGFPTLKAFKNGQMAFEYNGPRDADGIVRYMKSKAGPSSKEIKSVAEMEKFLSGMDQSVVGFFEDDSELQKQFMKVADALNEDFRFAHASSEEVLNKYGYKSDVVIFQPKHLNNKFEDDKRRYSGDAKLSAIKTWVTDNVHGLCGHRTTANDNQFKRPLVVAYYDVDYVKNPKGSNYWRNRVMKVGKGLSDAGKKVYFAVSSKSDFSHELSEFGRSPSGDKPIVAAKDAREQKFIMTEEFSMEALEKFINDFLDGKLEPYLKSEPVPEDNEQPVKVVVAKTFDQIVNDDSKDVLIEFYAPWCGHCKSLAPKYDELAEKLADEEEIVIAKMDATANDVPKPFDVRGFPTLYFAPKGSKSNPKKYEGGREVDEFIKYLAKESTNPLNGYDRKGKKTKKSKSEL